MGIQRASEQGPSVFQLAALIWESIHFLNF